MNWKIREMKDSDWDTMVSFYQEGIESGIVNVRTEAPSKETWERIHYPECRLVLENDHGEVCGFASLAAAKRLPAYHGFAELSIYIGRKWQHQRAGSALLWGLIEESERAGIWTLTVSVFSENMPSIRLFEAHGFKKVGVHEKAVKQNGKWVDLILLERRSQKIN